MSLPHLHSNTQFYMGSTHLARVAGEVTEEVLEVTKTRRAAGEQGFSDLQVFGHSVHLIRITASLHSAAA